MKRREFLKCLGFAILTIGFAPKRVFASKSSPDSIIIRPPGALTEEDFVKTCIRCDECIKVCPANCIKQFPITNSFSGAGTPYIVPRQAGCIRCSECMKVCPTGALRPIQLEQIKTGTADIYKDQCLVWTNQKECLVCMEFCPVGAISTDSKGRPVVDPAICVGCGLCEQNCPVTTSLAAIRVASVGEKRYHLHNRKYY